MSFLTRVFWAVMACVRLLSEEEMLSSEEVEEGGEEGRRGWGGWLGLSGSGEEEPSREMASERRLGGRGMVGLGVKGDCSVYV